MDDPLAEPVEAPTVEGTEKVEYSGDGGTAGDGEGEPVQEEEHKEGQPVEAPSEVGEKVEDPDVGVTDEDGKGEPVQGEQVEGEQVEGENVEGEHIEGDNLEGENIDGENVEGEHIEGENLEVEHLEGEHLEGELQAGEALEGEEPPAENQGDEEVIDHDIKEMEELGGEEMEGEHMEVEEAEKPEADVVEEVVEEEVYVETPPPDPAEPYNLTDSDEALRPPYELSPDQQAEVEQLWAFFQDYTPAYTDLDNYITEKELVFMMKALLVMTYTLDQLRELIAFCVRPPSPEGHILYEHFVKMVTMRQRDFPVEDELRAALCVMDPQKTGLIDRAFMRESLLKLGHKMPDKLLDVFIKEVDIANDGTIGIEDVVGTLMIDLNKEDIIILMNILNPPQPQVIPDRSQQNIAED